jgi:2'-5' RNA ligase
VPKLFVAVGLPVAAAAELAVIQPPRIAGVRLAALGQMHLTLHFLGPANAGRTAAALRAVEAPAFPLEIEGIGQFPSAGGAVTLWAGVRESAGLLRLHAAVAAALAAEGFQPEVRRYSPHITLARLAPGVPAGVVAEFLDRHRAFAPPLFPAAGFGLYSSTFAGDAPVYRRERSFPLLVPDGGGRVRQAPDADRPRE